MKRVSYKIAKALKEAGYPQEWNDTEFFYTENGELKRGDDYEGNPIEDIMYYQRYAVPAPFVMEIWLWLWREKKINIDISKGLGIDVRSWVEEGREARMFKRYDPEEAIIAAIDYLVANKLLK